MMFDLGYVRPEEVPQIPPLAKPPSAIVYAPLGDTPVAPDVVLFASKPSAAMLLQEAATRAGIGTGVPALGRPTCMALPASLEHGAVLSLGCVGIRVYTDVGEDEVYLFGRGKDVPVVADALTVIISANTALHDYAKSRRLQLASVLAEVLDQLRRSTDDRTTDRSHGSSVRNICRAQDTCHLHGDDLIEIERSPYPKRSGFRDFGLIDLPPTLSVARSPILAGLHHECRLESSAMPIHPEGFELSALMVHLPPVTGCHMVEIGCGDGRLTRRYCARVESVLAIDPDGGTHRRVPRQRRRPARRRSRGVDGPPRGAGRVCRRSAVLVGVVMTTHRGNGRCPAPRKSMAEASLRLHHRSAACGSCAQSGNRDADDIVGERGGPLSLMMSVGLGTPLLMQLCGLLSRMPHSSPTARRNFRLSLSRFRERVARLHRCAMAADASGSGDARRSGRLARRQPERTTKVARTSRDQNVDSARCSGAMRLDPAVAATPAPWQRAASARRRALSRRLRSALMPPCPSRRPDQRSTKAIASRRRSSVVACGSTTASVSACVTSPS